MELNFVLKEYPDINNCKTMLYLGADPIRFPDFYKGFESFDMTVLEIDTKNFNVLIKSGYKSILGDFRDVDKFFKKKSFDIIYWEDGPEHVHPQDNDIIIPKLIKISKRFIVFEAPKGPFPHSNDSDLETQHQEIYIDTFEKYGFISFEVTKKKNKKRIVSIKKI